MSQDFYPIIVCDSRGKNFERYSQPDSFKIHFIIQRGGTISTLQKKCLDFLSTLKSNLVPVVKIGVGINDLLKLESHQEGKIIIPSNTHSSDTVVDSLKNFKSEILSVLQMQ